MKKWYHFKLLLNANPTLFKFDPKYKRNLN